MLINSATWHTMRSVQHMNQEKLQTNDSGLTELKKENCIIVYNIYSWALQITSMNPEEPVQWSRDSFELSPCGDAQHRLSRNVQRIDQFESYLLCEDTLMNGDALLNSITMEDLCQEGACSTQTTPQNGSSSPLQAGQSEPTVQSGDEKMEVEQDNVILFASGRFSPWDSEKDRGDSSGSCEAAPKNKKVTWQDENAQEEKQRQCNRKLIQLICDEGIHWRPGGWRIKYRNPTVQLFTDRLLHNWSRKDQMVRLQLHNFSHIGQWSRAVREHQVQVLLPITVISLQCIKQLECMDPLKNAIAMLGRAIRNC